MDYHVDSHPSGISFIIPCKDDQHLFTVTFSSVYSQTLTCDEIIVVDSSSSTVRSTIQQLCSSKTFVRYIYMDPQGVYAAHNLGISLANNPFLWIVNSGDIVLPDRRHIVDDYVRNNPKTDVFVFSQTYGYNINSVIGTSFPSTSGFWPHQSIVYRRNLHSVYGLYSEKLKYMSDQLFFAHVRRSTPFLLLLIPVTYYQLGGLSSTYNTIFMREKVYVMKLLNQNFLKILVTCFFMPYIRFLLSALFGLQTPYRLRRLLLRKSPKAHLD